MLENRLVSTTLSHGAASKTTAFLETTLKMSSASLTFDFSSSGGELDLKIEKTFLKIKFFRCSASTKIT